MKKYLEHTLYIAVFLVGAYGVFSLAKLNAENKQRMQQENMEASMSSPANAFTQSFRNATGN